MGSGHYPRDKARINEEVNYSFRKTFNSGDKLVSDFDVKGKERLERRHGLLQRGGMNFFAASGDHRNVGDSLGMQATILFNVEMSDVRRCIEINIGN
jgi:hypothetical protein